MPTSKEVRARQNRQKDRVAAQLAERQRKLRRRRQIGAGIAVVLVVSLVAVAFKVGVGGDANTLSVVPTTAATVPKTTTTAAPLASAKGKPCVGLKDPLPKGAPSMLIAPGPAPTKLAKQDLKVGTGAVVPPKGKVTVDYIGVSCSTGKIFDSTYAHKQTFDADLSGQLIEGWKQGVPGMKVGGLRLLTIPPGLGYGAQGSPPAIAPDEALYFLISAVKLG